MVRDGAGPGEDATDRPLTDPMTEAEHLALDPTVSPTWVLPRNSEHQVTDLRRDRRPSRPVRMRPVPADELAVPGQQRAR